MNSRAKIFTFACCLVASTAMKYTLYNENNKFRAVDKTTKLSKTENLDLINQSKEDVLFLYPAEVKTAQNILSQP